MFLDGVTWFFSPLATPPRPRDPISRWMERNPGRAYGSAIVLVPTLALAVFSPLWLRDYRLERGGREMIATVRATQPHEHGGLVTVDYGVNGRTYSTTTPLGDDRRSIETVRPGDTVRITYLPSDPEVARGGHPPRDTLAGAAEMAGAAALLAAIVWFVPLYQNPRRRQRDATQRAAAGGS